MNRNIFITGATSGIGKETAYAFAKNGDNVILCARNIEKLKEIKADIDRNMELTHIFLYWMLLNITML